MKARNPSTGTLETVYVKALDSMPVGTQIEFIGDTIPTGWEEVNDYSTTEIDTGKKWIDGKPVYRKVISTNSPSSTNTSTTVGTVGALDTLVSISGNVYVSESVGLIPLPQAFGTDNFVWLFIENKASGNVNMRIQNSAYVNKPVIVVVEYTKSS